MKQLATLLMATGIFGLFFLAKDRKSKTSPALWIPGLWLFIGTSRNLSEWMDMHAPAVDAGRYIEGNSTDRNFLSALIALGILVLVNRREQVIDYVKRNPAIVLFFFYCGLSSLWSDFPDVAFKRWFRALGDLVMVLVVLTDPNWTVALRRLLSRVAFIAVPLSILFVRYYPDLGRSYSRWTGEMHMTGVTTDKNALGMVCVILGLASVSYLARNERSSWRNQTSRTRLVHLVVLGGAVWILLNADSATALACFFLSSAVLVLSDRVALVRKPALLHLLVLGVLAVPVSAIFLGASDMVSAVGRDATITGRTDIWRMTITLTPNRLLGAGFESFWLGDRLAAMWKVYYNHPNQAHNGYLEVFLNLGWVGVLLLACILIGGYVRILRAIRERQTASELRLAFFIAAAIYNLSEAGFKMMHPMWLVLLLSTSSMPDPVEQPAVVQPDAPPRPSAPPQPYIPEVRHGVRQAVPPSRSGRVGSSAVAAAMGRAPVQSGR